MSRAKIISLFANDLANSGLNYPATDGNAGQAIVTDGLGNLTFGNVDTGGVDSAATLALIDSAYVAARTPSGVKTFYRFTATSGQTSFTGLDLGGDTLTYDADNVSVFMNGILLADSDDYIATDGSSVTLRVGADSNDDLFITSVQNSLVGGKPPSVTINQYLFTATAGQSTFSGSDDNGVVLKYAPNNVIVAMNGLILKDTEDYTASNGTSIALVQSADSGDELLFTSLNQGIHGSFREVSSASYTIRNTERLIIDTSSSATSVVLPLNPIFGDEVKIIDGTGNANSNNITIDRNSNRINGVDSDYIISTSRGIASFVYYNDSNGWISSE